MKHPHPKKTESETSRARTRARAAWYCLAAVWVLYENSPEDMAIMKLDHPAFFIKLNLVPRPPPDGHGAVLLAPRFLTSAALDMPGNVEGGFPTGRFGCFFFGWP